MESKTKQADSPVALDIGVRFAETDLMGVVHHSSYIVWFECGRV
ncbi:MAG: acyl-CoA thioesterase, partial [Chloroflexota bacterium]|nr:acyl-CoA thioesterase [Chloroflexota bacterium]